MSQSLKVILTCPLGSTCEEIKDGAIHRCNWYINMRGENPQTGEKTDEWGCAIPWQNIQMVELCRTNHSLGAAIESFRNEMVKGNEKTLQLMHSQQFSLEHDDGK